MSRPQPTFDRLRPRSTVVTAPPAGSQARRPLFSVDEPGEAAFGSISIECSHCHEISVLALRQAMRLAIPSVYLPVIRGRYPTWLHCPACGDWTWTRVRMRL
ncbi:MAG TPA: hypothetical protein VHZ96_08985 [Frankiaceae bacterium]|jgi:hypothetical protein|nr:hypothetical protein [Frankiaceae bacterium]